MYGWTAPREQLQVPPVYHFSATERAELSGVKESLREALGKE